MIFLFLKNNVFLGKGNYANNEANSPKTTKHEAICGGSSPRKNYRKRLTAIAASFHPVSLNIVLQKAPVLIDQGFFYFSNQFDLEGLSSIRILLPEARPLVSHQNLSVSFISCCHNYT